MQCMNFSAPCIDCRRSTAAGEFGRTVYCQGNLTPTDYGRDHHPRCFSIWMAGGGIKGGQVYGQTDDMSCNIVADPVHIRDLHATIASCASEKQKDRPEQTIERF